MNLNFTFLNNISRPSSFLLSFLFVSSREHNVRPFVSPLLLCSRERMNQQVQKNTLYVGFGYIIYRIVLHKVGHHQSSHPINSTGQRFSFTNSLSIRYGNFIMFYSWETRYIAYISDIEKDRIFIL